LTKSIFKQASHMKKSMLPIMQIQKAAFHSSKPLNEVITVRDSLRIAMSDEMRRDDKVFLMGEEVG